MRRSGTVESVAGLMPRGHLTWAYEGRGEFRARGVHDSSEVVARIAELLPTEGLTLEEAA